MACFKTFDLRQAQCSGCRPCATTETVCAESAKFISEKDYGSATVLSSDFQVSVCSAVCVWVHCQLPSLLRPCVRGALTCACVASQLCDCQENNPCSCSYANIGNLRVYAPTHSHSLHRTCIGSRMSWCFRGLLRCMMVTTDPLLGITNGTRVHRNCDVFNNAPKVSFGWGFLLVRARGLTCLCRAPG